jgi:hypothetical protein
MWRAAATTHSDQRVADLVRREAEELHNGDTDYNHLLELIGDARVVLIGEASHGTVRGAEWHETHRAAPGIRMREPALQPALQPRSTSFTGSAPRSRSA